MANIPHVELSDTFDAQRNRLNQVIDATNENLPLQGGDGITVNSGTISVQKTGDGLEFDSNGNLVGNDAAPNLITQVALDVEGTSPVPTQVEATYIRFPEFDVIFDKKVYYGQKLGDFKKIHVPITTMVIQAGADGVVYVYVNDAGQILQQTTMIDPADSSVKCLLGSYFRLNNQLQALSWTYTPWNGATSKDTRFAQSAAISGGLISASGTNTFTRNAISVVYEGVNVKRSIYNPNRTEYEGKSPYTSKALWPGYNASVAETTQLDTTHIFNITSNTVDDISSKTGFIILVPGIVSVTGQDVYLMAMSPKVGNDYPQIYSSLNEAREAIYGYQVSLGNVAARVSWLGQTIIAKIGATDYSDSTQVQVVGQIPNVLGSQTVSTGAGPGIEIEGLTIKSNGTVIGETSTKTSLDFSDDFTLMNTSGSEVGISIVDRINPKIGAGILEVPQDIKLDIDSNGKAWIRAGSRVYNLDGTSFVTNADVAIGRTNSSNDYIFLLNSGNTTVCNPWTCSNVYTGPAAPTGSIAQNTMWLDTTNWVLKYTTNSGSTWNNHACQSFPVAIVKNKDVSGEIEQVDNIFNGLGYFGQVFFTLPGLKVLIQNGRNSDGSMKYYEILKTNVSKALITVGSNRLYFSNSGFLQISDVKYIESTVEPEHSTTLWYDTNTNFMKYWDNTNNKWVIYNWCCIGKCIKSSNSNVSSFEPYPPFQFANRGNTVNTDSDQTIMGTKNFINNVSVGQNLTVGGTATIAGNTTIQNGSLYVNVGRIDIQSEQPFVQVHDSNLDVTNNASISGDHYQGIYNSDNNNHEIGYFRTHAFNDTINNKNVFQAEVIAVDPDVNHTNDAGNRVNTQLYLKTDGTTRIAALNFNPSTSNNSSHIATTHYVREMLNAIYPVGAIYIGTTGTCPLEAFFGTWTLIQGRYLLASGTLAGTSETYSATNTVAAGLPNITGGHNSTTKYPGDNLYGAFTVGSYIRDNPWDGIGNLNYRFNFEAGASNTIYRQSTTVRPPAYVVNVWRRTA